MVIGEPFARYLASTWAARTGSGSSRPDLSEETAWKTKGTNAPGAATPSTRLDTLEVMGIDRQLIFPEVIMAIPVWRGDDFGTRVRAAFNDAVVRWTEEGQGRLRPTALLATHDLAVAIDEAAAVIDAGARAVLVPDGVPTGAVSPASDEADPLCALLAKTDTPVLLHIGGQQGFFGSDAWDKAPSLAPGAPGKGEPVGPHMLATMHFAAMNYLTTMIFGGVFERHPFYFEHHRPSDRAVRTARGLRLRHRLPPPRRRDRPDRRHLRRGRAARRRRGRTGPRHQRRAPASGMNDPVL